MIPRYHPLVIIIIDFFKAYNSLYVNALKKVFEAMYRTQYATKLVVHKVLMNYVQISGNDCGFFLLAFIDSLMQTDEPSLICFDQNKMRTNYNDFIDFTLTYYSADNIILANYSKDTTYQRIYVTIGEDIQAHRYGSGHMHT
jgi:hypothetical protein